MFPPNFQSSVQGGEKIKTIRNLTEELIKAEAKDRFYTISGKIIKMLAPQHYQRPFIYIKKGWGQIERIESTSDGTPNDLRANKRKKRVRKGEQEIKTADCWTFRIEDNRLMLPWGTQFGIFKKSLLRSLEAQRKLRYDAAPLTLMKVYPLWLNVGHAPCESQQDKAVPEIILETRHTQSGDVMVEAFFDYIQNRDFTCYVEVDSEAPINEEKFVALIKTLNTLDNIGPSKRGAIEISKIEQIELEKDDLRKMETGEAVLPTVY